MSKPKNQLTIVRLASGDFVELTNKTKKMVCVDTEYFQYTVCKTPFDVNCYIKKARNERQRIMRHRGVACVK